MARLYLLSTEEVKRIPEEYFREHFPLRYEKAGKYRFEADRLRSLGVGVLLKTVLDVREKDLRTGLHGKLYVPGKGKKFNVSHSGEYTVLAVSDGEVGVDIEKKEERHLDVARRVYTPEELEWMNAAEDREERTDRFFTLWTCKESVMKQLGLGMSLAPESFSVLSFLKERSIRIGEKELFGRTMELPGYRIAVCTEAPEELIVPDRKNGFQIL